MIQNIILVTLFISTNGYFSLPRTDVDPNPTSKWPSLKITFDPRPLSKGFDKMPLTAQYAPSQGWTPTGRGCLNNGQFAGHRYIHKGDTSISLLYDVNGIISGIQMNVKIEELRKSPNPFRFAEVSMFQRNVIQNDDVLTVTVYFLDPIFKVIELLLRAKICRIGRTREQLKEEGLGHQLYVQSGPTPAHFFTPPMTREVALNSSWSNNKCYPMMGTHTFYDAEHMDDRKCQGGKPIFLLFNNRNHLHGFGIQYFGRVKSHRYENAPLNILEAIVGTELLPQCMRDWHEVVGQTTMHVFFFDDPRIITCP